MQSFSASRTKAAGPKQMNPCCERCLSVSQSLSSEPHAQTQQRLSTTNRKCTWGNWNDNLLDREGEIPQSALAVSDDEGSILLFAQKFLSLDSIHVPMKPSVKVSSTEKKMKPGHWYDVCLLRSGVERGLVGRIINTKFNHQQIKYLAFDKIFVYKMNVLHKSKVSDHWLLGVN